MVLGPYIVKVKTQEDPLAAKDCATRSRARINRHSKNARRRQPGRSGRDDGRPFGAVWRRATKAEVRDARKSPPRHMRQRQRRETGGGDVDWVDGGSCYGRAGAAGAAGQAAGILHHCVEYIGRNFGDTGGCCGGEHFSDGRKSCSPSVGGLARLRLLAGRLGMTDFFWGRRCGTVETVP